ncbi:hypothetical protein [Microlunatus flavus]|uniref:Uncharacterized protein n=1 Tax=Microlunatus flavus TaxID=1036181 RepID=A0A1H9EXI6_9ACTN|nr:hypothetical protein [Microlunatus flavus]SEQ30486.1 hypothetical protein SAMN05421756_10385 [Microlunatus flavus]
MALRTVYNPPPNWPDPPPGWKPPPGWQPDPSWGPPPEGWELWTKERANPYAWLFGLGSGVVLLVVLIAIGTIAAGTPPSPEAFGEILGRCVTAGIVTSIIAWVSTRRWGLWLYPLITLGVSLFFSVLTTVGRQNGA